MWIAEFVSKVKTRYMQELAVPAIIAVDAIAKKKKNNYHNEAEILACPTTTKEAPNKQLSPMLRKPVKIQATERKRQEISFGLANLLSGVVQLNCQSIMREIRKQSSDQQDYFELVTEWMV